MLRARHAPSLLALILFAAPACAPLAAHPAPQRGAGEPAAELGDHLDWIAAGPREDIDWDVRHRGPWLRFDQRLHLLLEVRIDGKTLNRRGDRHDLLFVARVADASGQWLPERGLYRVRIEEPLNRRTRVVVRMGVVVRPGRLTFAVVMLDRLSGARNVFLRRLEIPPLRNDPLAAAWSSLPPAEFIGAGDQPGATRLPDVEGRLHLPVETARPVEVEILAVLTASEQYAGSVAAQQATFARLMPTLDVLSNLSLARGSLRLTAVDLVRRRVVYHQELTRRRLDWPALREAAGEIQPTVVSAAALEAQRERAAWFRGLLEERLADHVGDSGESTASPADPPPHRVLIIVSSAQLFPRRSDLEPIQLPAAADTAVYHLEFRIEQGNLWDELGRILRPLRPRRRVIEQPIHLRRALAEILRDLNAL
jgi:hypothetical protein